MAEKRLTREESQAQTRERLLEAARIVFVQAGYRGASVDAIAAEAGYSKGAVYSNFEGKEDLFLELKRLYADAELAKFDALITEIAARKSNVEDMTRIVRSWLDAFMADSEWLVLGIELQLHARRNAAFAARYGALNDQHRAALAAIFRRLFVAVGKVPPKDCAIIADAVIGTSLGLALENSVNAAEVMMATVSSFLAAAPNAEGRD